ncbi:hypothetical protein DFJ74DRAFT_668159 [Hyaloraphidium curvatum]|nr:hypothetical protein DFJ74DRAFT_668159 [Hyaloraphidium curvatum]
MPRKANKKITAKAKKGAGSARAKPLRAKTKGVQKRPGSPSKIVKKLPKMRRAGGRRGRAIPDQHVPANAINKTNARKRCFEMEENFRAENPGMWPEPVKCEPWDYVATMQGGAVQVKPVLHPQGTKVAVSKTFHVKHVDICPNKRRYALIYALGGVACVACQRFFPKVHNGESHAFCSSQKHIACFVCKEKFNTLAGFQRHSDKGTCIAEDHGYEVEEV